MYPDFLGIGAQKAGTTWLYRNMRAHPELWMPKEKELHYFDEKMRQEGGLRARLGGDRPEDTRWRRQAGIRLKRFPKSVFPDGFALRDLAWDLRYFFGRPSDGWYASLFAPGKGKISGETTPDYSILDEGTIAHVRELMPEAKILFMVRNPIERPWSVLDMGLRVKGREVEGIPDDVIYAALDNKRVRQMTSYMRIINNWNAHFPEDQIFVGFLEDVHFFPEELLRRVYGFLGASTSKKYRVIKRKIHSGQQTTMPTRFAAFLAGVYHRQLKVTDRLLGGYAGFWLHCAENLLDGAVKDETLPYPLWDSALWDGWAGAGSIEPQSGPLPSVARTAR